MKIFSRIIETLLAVTMLFSGLLVFDEGCSCGQCYSEEIRMASCVLFASIVAEIVILIIKAFKQHFMIGVFDFVSTILLVVGIVLAAGTLIGTIYRISNDRIGDALKYFISFGGPTVIIGLFTYASIWCSKKMKSATKSDQSKQKEYGENE
ncbi:MAG: hypothetical protein IJO70_07705 [Lachnospiraceae bacterium]|nr:hypothetical protein [Lachnospiraceae bacterium]